MVKKATAPSHSDERDDALWALLTTVIDAWPEPTYDIPEIRGAAGSPLDKALERLKTTASAGNHGDTLLDFVVLEMMSVLEGLPVHEFAGQAFRAFRQAISELQGAKAAVREWQRQRKSRG